MKRSFLIIAGLASLVLLLMTGASLFAAEKPQIVSCTAQYVDRAVSLNIQWQSQNPVVMIRVVAGREVKEVKVDEYDNRKNRDGYSGEINVTVHAEAVLMQDSIPYTVQLEDDLRLKSSIVSGKAPVPSKFAKQEDDSWGREKIMGVGQPAAAAQPGQSGDIIDKLLGVMERHDTPPFLHDVTVNPMGPGNVSFSSKATDDKGLKEINFKVLDASGKQVGDQQFANAGKVWQGSTKTFTLDPGNYKVVAQAVDTGGNTSQERSTPFVIGALPKTFGSLTATIAPQEVVTAQGQWRVDGGAWQNSGAKVDSIVTGEHTVEYKDVAGWVKPDNQKVTVENGKVATTAGTYTVAPAQSGALSVTILPQGAIDAGAQWQVDGGAWQSSGGKVESLAVGEHTVEYKDVAGWTKPVGQKVTVELNKTAVSAGTYSASPPPTGSLTFTIAPQLVVEAGAQWRVDGGAWQNSGASLPNITAGQHTVDFKDVAGWVKPPNQIVTIAATQTTSASAGYGKLYTANKDFEEGQLIGVEDKTTIDQLQLTKTATTLPFIWIPNSNEGTISKVDTRTGAELGRYRTGPQSNGSPSRTTVDLKGNCWVGNRNTGTVVKVGLNENGQCVDRNADGRITTSSGSNVLPWGQDECVLLEVALFSGREATYVPGQYTGSYDGAPGPRGIAIDAQNNVWAGTFGTCKFYNIDGNTGKILKTINTGASNHCSYGALIDANGILWSADISRQNVLRMVPATGALSVISLGHQAYGLGIDKNNHLFVGGWTNNKLTRINTITAQKEWTKDGEYGIRGVAITSDGDVWTANSLSNTVTRWSNDGQRKASISGFNHPTGVATDKEGKVWAVNYNDSYIKRIDPATNRIDLEKAVGSGHYGYSDMTGILARSVTTRTGTWTATLDSKGEGTKWNIISWTASEPQGTSVKVKARSSSDQKNWAAWEDVGKGVALTKTPAGRYIQIETTLQLISGEVSPILNDLTVSAK